MNLFYLLWTTSTYPVLHCSQPPSPNNQLYGGGDAGGDGYGASRTEYGSILHYQCTSGHFSTNPDNFLQTIQCTGQQQWIPDTVEPCYSKSTAC